jgi:hypothetical protein
VRQATSGWLGASALVAEATSVNTRFTVPVRTVIVVLAGADTPSFDEVIVELTGAKRVADKAGVERAPRVVMSGSRATLIYDVVPTRGMTVAVSVQTGGQWRLAGVLGGMLDSTTVAQTIAVRGVAAVVGRLLVAADGAPVVVDWNPPPDRVGARTEKKSATRAATKKTTAKKSARRGSSTTSAATKSVSTKSATKTVTRKTSAAKKSTTRSTAKKRVSKKSPARRTTARTTATTTRRGGK